MKEPVEVKEYICVHVYDDGDNELTKRELTKEQCLSLIYDGDLCFNVLFAKKNLTKELLEYGNELEDIEEALQYILNVEPGTSCIVGKV